ncbi:hypothetical protein P7C70_g4616, partial [Phenoliferia sp. Uapishka_3]
MFRLPALRTSVRTALPRASRQYSAAAPAAENEFVAEREAIKHHAAKSGELWRKITYVHQLCSLPGPFELERKWVMGGADWRLGGVGLVRVLNGFTLSQTFTNLPFLLPVVVGYLNAMNIEKEHHAHAEHIKEENDGETPARIVYLDTPSHALAISLHLANSLSTLSLLFSHDYKMASPKPPTEVTSLLPPPSEPPIDVASSPPNWIDPLSLTSNNRAGILAGIWTATFLASINTTLVATLLTSISSEFDSANEASWLGTSYLLATATFTPLYGRLSNVLGRRGANQLAVFLVLAKTSTEAGAHLMPNSVSMSLGSLFAGYVTALLRNSEGMTHIIDASFVMHRTGKYKTLNVVFGILPFLATLLIIRLSPESGFFTQWLSIIPLGFGNAVVLQTTLIALLVSIDHSHMAVGTGFVQLFRGVGQVAGVAIPSAMFQSILRTELQTRITGPGSAELISKIRHNSRVVNTLPTEIQATVREAFRIGLRSVFIFAAICTFLAFVVRLGIPEQSLDKDPSHSDSDGEPMTDNSEDEAEDSDRDSIRTIAAPDLLPPPPPPPISPSPSPRRIPVRRLSTYMSDDGMDPEVGVPQSWKSSVGRRAGSRQSSLVVGSWVSGAAGRSGVVLEEGDGVEHTAV